MRTALRSRPWTLARRLTLASVLVVGAALRAQTPAVPDPIPERPVMSRLGLVVREVATFPKSDPVPAPSDKRLVRHARINALVAAPDGSGRLFVPDLNGTLYLLRRGGRPAPYLDVRREIGADFFSGRGLGSGLGFVAFHPEFARNGRFYTVHTEAGDALARRTPDFAQPRAQVHGVITEWTATSSRADTFAGRRREVLRLGFTGFVHGIQQIDFDPTARPGDEGYGLLYVAVGDGGTGAVTQMPQDLRVPFGKILRIRPTPAAGAAGARYGVPTTNPFVGRTDAAGAVWASGMRDPHRFSWDPATRRLLLAHIGERQVESIYEVRAGDNLGWSEREGPLAVDRSDPCALHALPPDDARRGFVYPVAAYDHERPPWLECGHDVGHAVAGGFVYRGRALPALQGRYLFTDIVDGRVMFAEAARMRRGGPRATIHELAIFDAAGRETTMPLLAGSPRVDLRLGRDADGAPYLLSKANGKVWKVVGTRAVPRSATLFPSLVRDVVSHWDFEHPDPADPAVERDRGGGGVPLRLVNGGARMRVRDGAHPASRTSIQLRQVSPGRDGNDDWKAGMYAATGVPGLRAFAGARGATVMGWFKVTDTIPGLESTTPDPADRHEAVGLAGVLSGDSDGHLVRAMLELITVDGALRLAAVGRRVDGGRSQTYVAAEPWERLLPRGEWVFLAATFDFATGRMALYRNGRGLAGARRPADDPWQIAGPGPHAASATDPRGVMVGGSYPQNTRERNPCGCRVDDLILLDRVLAPLEVDQQYRRMAARP